MNLAGCDLQGLGVLVTRPLHQAAGLCSLIEAQQGRPLLFPALEIAPPAAPDQAARALREPADLFIFISPNAVDFARRWLAGQPLPAAAKVAAVGSGTAQALQQAGMRVDLLPADRFDSEGLLALPELSRLAGRRVVIVRGEGGRALLGDTLQARGADLVYAEVYRRRRPDSDPGELLQHWRQRVDLVTVTSSEILDNLLSLLGRTAWPLLCQTPLLVISERMQERAKELGFRTILLAANAGNQAILERLCSWVEAGR